MPVFSDGSLVKVIEDKAMDMILQPVRFKIVRLLMKSEKPMYIEQIADAVGEPSRLVSHHLEILEDKGIVISQFEIIKKSSPRPVAGRFFEMTEKGQATLKEFGKAISGEG